MGGHSYDRFRAPQLAELCKKRGLNNRGTRKQMIERLKENDEIRGFGHGDTRSAPILKDDIWGYRVVYPAYIPPHLQYISEYLGTLSIRELEYMCRAHCIVPDELVQLEKGFPADSEIRRNCLVKIRAARQLLRESRENGGMRRRERGG